MSSILTSGSMEKTHNIKFYHLPLMFVTGVLVGVTGALMGVALFLQVA